MTHRSQIRRLIRFWSIVLATWTLVACTIPNVPTEHIIMVNSEGVALDPTGNVGCDPEPALCNGRHVPLWFLEYRPLDADLNGTNGKHYEAYLKRLIATLQAHPKSQNGKRKLLLFVHGGLNEQTDSLRRATKLAKLLEEQEKSEYFPIFINWDSSFYASYYDHLFHVRQGEYVAWWNPRGLLLSPAYLLLDIVRGIAGAPVLWTSELMKVEADEWPRKLLKKPEQEGCEDQPLPFIGLTFEDHYERVSCQLKAEYRRCLSGIPGPSAPCRKVIPISEGEDERKWFPEQFLSGVTWTLTLPTKIAFAPIVDAFGASAWNNMLRRTRRLFHTETEFTRGADGPYSPPAGALAVFMRHLQQAVSKQPDEWEITLVGHSMGTIILNEMIRRFGVVTETQLAGASPASFVMPFDRIVYMAAASSIRDYEDSIFPYLTMNTNAQFYHLTLHEEAEERERQDLGLPNTDWEIPYVDPLMRGSLLVWIDDFLSNPQTYLDRTLGSYANLMLTAHDTPNEIRDRIHIKAFSAGTTEQAPQKHAEFTNKFRFWREACWTPSQAPPPNCYEKNGLLP